MSHSSKKLNKISYNPYKKLSQDENTYFIHNYRKKKSVAIISIKPS
jgi:hypothetical protein